MAQSNHVSWHRKDQPRLSLTAKSASGLIKDIAWPETNRGAEVQIDITLNYIGPMALHCITLHYIGLTWPRTGQLLAMICASKKIWADKKVLPLST